MPYRDASKCLKFLTSAGREVATRPPFDGTRTMKWTWSGITKNTANRQMQRTWFSRASCNINGAISLNGGRGTTALPMRHGRDRWRPPYRCDPPALRELPCGPKRIPLCSLSAFPVGAGEFPCRPKQKGQYGQRKRSVRTSPRVSINSAEGQYALSYGAWEP